MKKRITHATKKQWDAIGRIRERWLFQEQTAQYPDQRIRECVWKFLDNMDIPRVPVWCVDSPLMARAFQALHSAPSGQLYGQLDDQLSDQLYGQLSGQLSGQLRDHLYGQLDSQLYGQLYDQLSGQLRDQLYDQLYGQLDSQLRGQLYDQLYGQLDSQLYGQLRDQLYDHLYGQLDSQLYGQLYGQLDSQLAGQLADQSKPLKYYCGIWWNARAAWYEGGAALGVDKLPTYDEFLEWNRVCPVWLWDDSQIFVLKRPTEIHWDSEVAAIHNDSGAAVVYSDLFKLWRIEGVAVDEQIVMRPETQTISQINGEENEEVRRIRIERFGVMRYLDESGATVLEARRNEIENTYEILADTPHGQRLVTHCPSTGRRYFLSLPDNVTTCAQAQRSLWGIDCNIIGRT